MGLPECDTPLVWIMIFTRSSGATAVLAHAPAVPPDSSSYGTHRIRERGQTQQGGTGQSPRRAEPSGGGGGGGEKEMEGRSLTLTMGWAFRRVPFRAPRSASSAPASSLVATILELKSPLSQLWCLCESSFTSREGHGFRWYTIRYPRNQFPCVLWFVLSIPIPNLPFPSPSPSPTPCASLGSLKIC